ncbi:MAG: molybdenum cofactor biosynthesis protein MoaE [Tepidisphaeraceae bacterium]
MIALAPDPIDPAELLAAFIVDAAGAGAIASFTGLVRDTHDGVRVEGLWLDHHQRITAQALDEIGDVATDRFGLSALTIVHRVGAVAAGEPIVFVAAAAAHRRAAFDAVDYIMDRLKTDAPLWKRETRSDGEHWIEARPDDHHDRARWENVDGA